MGMNEIYFVLIVFLANIVEGITGFAGTLIAMPFAMLLIGIEDARGVLSIVALVTCVLMSGKNYRSINIEEVVKISTIMMLGMIVGIYISEALSISSLLKIYGIMIIFVALRGLLLKKEYKLNEFILTSILILAGIIHGMFLSGGALLVVYAVYKFRDKNEFRASLSAVWVILNSVLVIQNLVSGGITELGAKLSLWILLPLIVSLLIGGYLHKNMKQELFIKLTYALLLLSGNLLVFQ